MTTVKNDASLFQVPKRQQQVWELIRKQGPLNAYEAAELLPHIPYGTVSSTLSKLHKNKAVTCVGRRNGSRIYTTSLDKYEDWFVQETVEEPIETQQTVQSIPSVEEELDKPVHINLEDMTVREVRMLYKQLKELFGEN